MPMPLISVWPVSLSAFTVNVGSSRCSMSSACVELVLVRAADSGSIDWLTTASANVIGSSRIGCCVSQSVSPVIESLRPTTPTMSPAGPFSHFFRPRVGSAWTW